MNSVATIHVPGHSPSARVGHAAVRDLASSCRRRGCESSRPILKLAIVLRRVDPAIRDTLQGEMTADIRIGFGMDEITAVPRRDLVRVVIRILVRVGYLPLLKDALVD
jgi:hypothetical protein